MDTTPKQFCSSLKEYEQKVNSAFGQLRDFLERRQAHTDKTWDVITTRPLSEYFMYLEHIYSAAKSNIPTLVPQMLYAQLVDYFDVNRREEFNWGGYKKELCRDCLELLSGALLIYRCYSHGARNPSLEATITHFSQCMIRDAAKRYRATSSASVAKLWLRIGIELGALRQLVVDQEDNGFLVVDKILDITNLILMAMDSLDLL